MDVELIRWPAEADKRARVQASAAPLLLLVEPAVDPPEDLVELEDWIRLPADQRDMRARVMNLVRRAEARAQAAPLIDGGLLRFQGTTAPLPPVEARLAGALVERFDSVVPRDQLARAGWPDGPPGRNALDVHIMRLRRRLEPVGLAIRTVRSRGYLLMAAAVD